jgi:hypothetical protein
VTDWPAEWRPVNPEEAQKYLDAHQDGSGDPELLEECEALIEQHRPRRPPPGIPTGTKPSPFPKPPEDLAEEQRAARPRPRTPKRAVGLWLESPLRHAQLYTRRQAVIWSRISGLLVLKVRRRGMAGPMGTNRRDHQMRDVRRFD